MDVTNPKGRNNLLPCKTDSMQQISTRVRELLAFLQQGIYEKDTETALSLLAAVAGESVLLLGPPGVAKSMVARRLKLAFAGARSFEYLMSRFSTPDEIFGPVSIARLKEADKYERATEGYLPTAHVVFLDEIWKAGPAIQNTLLTVMNERLFRNGEQEVKLPLRLLVAASNELPAKGEGLEALWDRFLVRIVCRNIRDEQTFRTMLCDDDAAQQPQDTPLALTPEEYDEWQQGARRVGLAPKLLDAIGRLRLLLQKVNIEGNELPRRIYVSDRRWKHVATLLRASAYLQDRQEATVADLLPMYHCLWNEPDEVASVQRLVLQSLLLPYEERLTQTALRIKNDLRTSRTAQPAATNSPNGEDFAHYEGDIDALCNELEQLERALQDNLFVNDEDKQAVTQQMQGLYRQVALARVDVRKLLYNE